MVIKRSVGQEVQALLAELDADDEVGREAAIARLAVIGTRAVDRLIAVLATPSSTPRTTTAALRALESIGDVRALAPTLALLDSPHPEVGTAAVAVLRGFLHSPHDTPVLDRLVQFSLDAGKPDTARLAALETIAEIGSHMATPVWERLRDDPSLAVRQRAAKATGVLEPIAEVEAAAAGVLPEDPALLCALLDRTSGDAPLTTLHRLIETIKARETAERSEALKRGWLSARGAVHLALARRQSRVALYDLRDTIAAAETALPDSFLAALQQVGDASSLEAVASAYARAADDGAAEWLEHLKATFRAVAGRERVGPRHATLKRVNARWPQAAAALIDRKGAKK